MRAAAGLRTVITCQKVPRSRSRAARRRHRAQGRRRRDRGAPVCERGQVCTFGVYDEPTPEAIRKTIAHNVLSVDQIIERGCSTRVSPPDNP